MIKNINKLTLEIIDFLYKYDLYMNVNIYSNNKLYTFSECNKKDYIKKQTKNNNVYYIVENVKPNIEYTNPETITMTFEGPLYEALNYGDGIIAKKLRNIFNKYNLYYEQGYAWSLSAYEI